MCTYRYLKCIYINTLNMDLQNEENNKILNRHQKVKLPRTERNAVKYKGDWNNLPDLLLENIFSFLDIGAKHNASKTCTLWYSVFHLPYSWHTFVFDDTTLTRRKFNYYSGWQYMLDHLRVQLCLQSIGRYVKVLVFKPITNFYNLYEFMNMISFYAEHGQGIGSRISTLQYTFPCNMATSRIDESVLYGTGGKLLEALKRLMGNLPSLERLELIDLMLDNEDAQTLLDQVCFYCCTTLKTLVLVNTTKYLCQLLHPGAFINLQVLVISPQNLGSDLLLMLSQIRLSHLHILQNRYTPIEIEPMNSFDWKHCVKANATLKVHLRVESIRERQILWQPNSPVSSIIYKSPNMRMTADILNKAIELYSDRLLTFGYLELPKFYQPSSFKERIDTTLVNLIQLCPKLDTLMIREKISTCTLLLISYYGHSLKYLHVRRNAVILRCDWPRQNDWSDEFYQWLKKSSTSYEIVEEEIALSLGLSKWTMLSDRDFKRISPQLYSTYYK
ncbi:F-box/LRR-repeat protein 21 [Rhopalosiphum padi]|uniref:F-box/LRR-repeat protein 21 n=1 Tax=Rhopalosiphum padi TaxID=40932 RepID=UPI00298E35AB|nr:F-box/LRR-repeat protein 21 [Rhopalosiphum padi]XP_060837200.1 F-box/LRR-repeat protein 21 [Rhopalosiphum padi]